MFQLPFQPLWGSYHHSLLLTHDKFPSLFLVAAWKSVYKELHLAMGKRNLTTVV